MLLVIDIGNTNITIGVYKENHLVGRFRMTTRMERTSDEYGLMLSQVPLLNTFILDHYLLAQV